MLNPALDIKQIASDFQARQRLQIRNLLIEDAAQALHNCLVHEVPWGLACGGRNDSRVLLQPELENMAVEETAALLRDCYKQAAERFQFIYNSYMMVTAYKEKRDPGLLLHRVLEFLNSPIFLGFIKSVSGVDSIIKADAQATRYIPGHFLTNHDDMNIEKGRELAYVINLTREWQTDWGGLLHFLNEDGTVQETLFPIFNSLSLFRVPQDHCVSYVAPYAGGARYAITGWLLSR